MNDFRRKGLITLATAAALPVASTTFADRKTLGLGRSAFSSDAIKRGANRHFEVVGLDRKDWSTATPIRAIFKDAFTAAGSMLSSRPARNASWLEQLLKRKPPKLVAVALANKLEPDARKAGGLASWARAFNAGRSNISTTGYTKSLKVCNSCGGNRQIGIYLIHHGKQLSRGLPCYSGSASL